MKNQNIYFLIKELITIINNSPNRIIFVSEAVEELSKFHPYMEILGDRHRGDFLRNLNSYLQHVVVLDSLNYQQYSKVDKAIILTQDVLYATNKFLEEHNLSKIKLKTLMTELPSLLNLPIGVFISTATLFNVFSMKQANLVMAENSNTNSFTYDDRVVVRRDVRFTPLPPSFNNQVGFVVPPPPFVPFLAGAFGFVPPPFVPFPGGAFGFAPPPFEPFEPYSEWQPNAFQETYYGDYREQGEAYSYNEDPSCAMPETYYGDYREQGETYSYNGDPSCAMPETYCDDYREHGEAYSYNGDPSGTMPETYCEENRPFLSFSNISMQQQCTEQMVEEESSKKDQFADLDFISEQIVNHLIQNDDIVDDGIEEKSEMCQIANSTTMKINI